MPMGLVNSAATLCRLVESVFNIDTEPEIFAYIDDFIICSESFERHIELLQIVSTKMKDVGLAIGLKKSRFCMRKLKFLGHMIDENGLSIDPSRIEALNNYKRPTNRKEVQSFLGFAGWHRKFIAGYSDIAAPLILLTKINVKFVWTAEQENPFS